MYPTLFPIGTSSQSDNLKNFLLLPTPYETLLPPCISNMPPGNNPSEVDVLPFHILPRDAYVLLP
nr:MAG TPA: hypothetical protein [Caudoviricetes sp.]